MSKFLFALLLTISSLITINTASAQVNTRSQIQMIEEEYARQNNGRMIPDNQLEYYLDQSNAGWSMSQISQDMADSRRTYATTAWRPREGWIAREVICSSINSQYAECAAPFRGTAIITQQISASACIEGQSWGQRPGYIWVNRGCRARFGIVRTSSDNYPDNNRIVVCQSNRNRYRECATNIRGRVELVRRLNNSRACISGRSWGQRQGMVWVSRGCRAQFAAVNRSGNRDGRDWYRDSNYSVTCSSVNNLMTRCDWDSRYGNPRLVEQLSTQPCINGRNWGYDGRGIWVDQGCRARFSAQ
ncbi:MAG: DUF3011 domain-containing protein [Arenimonas sp.]